ncbi:hypothetical protein HLI_21600 (plasmid) [Halobacillus litoralis]|uniref:N-acetylmuramoyl-L-alanine amidase n=1 Tax=Halobacillus litoralis TaxID=45668 RepID=A0A410MJF3_9BACI|nr:hypothetical protein HLI_21600 [Halobacillus litoralis]
MSIAVGTALSRGDNGQDVLELQQALVENNFYPDIDAADNGVDGNYGPGTEDAVRRYQIVNGLTVDGKAGPETLSSMGLYAGTAGTDKITALQPGNTGASVRILQQALLDKNYSLGPSGVDGSYGPTTEDAVRRYQIMNNLTVDGMAGPETLSSLGIYAGISNDSQTIGALQPGDLGEEVRILQRTLSNKGYYSDSIDGSYGPATESAVRSYQSANNLTIDGMAGPGTLTSLGIYEGVSTGSPTIGALQPGDVGAEVEVLQQTLSNKGYYNDSIDGSYGPATESAVRSYQSAHNLTLDGKAGPETLSYLGIYNGTFNSTDVVALQPGDTGEGVRLLQQALVDNNFYPEIHAADYGVDGVYGPNTEDAVRRYQTINGLTVDGMAGPETLSSLGISGEGSGGSRGSGSYGSALLPGDVGDAVRLLQETLADKGYYNDSIDGSYGPATESAVRSYQSANGLTVDGMAGPETLNSLDLNGGSGGGEFSGGDFESQSISQLFIPPFNDNRPGFYMNPTYITIHETANTAASATAAMHANYVRNPTTEESWHFTVDDQPVVYQHLPLNEIGWHAGDGVDGTGNRSSIGIELCVNYTGDFSRTRKNAAALVHKLMDEYNISLQNVVPHNYWSGKNCPTNLLPIFGDFRQQVMDSIYEEIDPNDPTLHRVSSPFAVIDEIYSSESVGTVSYEKAYNVNFGPIKGTLSGTIILGDPTAGHWDLKADKAIRGDVLDGNINQALKVVLDEGLIPGASDVRQAKVEFDNLVDDELSNIVEIRMSSFDPKLVLEPPFVEMDWLTIEVLRKIGDGVYVLEKVVLNNIDWNTEESIRRGAGLALMLLIIAALLLSAGFLVATVREIIRYMGLPGMPLPLP